MYLWGPISPHPQSHPARWGPTPGRGREFNRTLLLAAELHLSEVQNRAKEATSTPGGPECMEIAWESCVLALLQPLLPTRSDLSPEG